MDSFNDAIGLEQLEAVLAADNSTTAQSSPAPQQHRTIAGKRREKLREQPVFADLSQLHCEITSGKASAVSASALKSACIVMETRREPLHS